MAAVTRRSKLGCAAAAPISALLACVAGEELPLLMQRAAVSQSCPPAPCPQLPRVPGAAL